MKKFLAVALAALVLITPVQAQTISSGGQGPLKTDQTTPGTTDLVTTRYTTPIFLTVTPTLGTAYTVGQSFGGLQTVTGLVAGKTYIIGTIRFVLKGTLTAISNLSVVVFNANPSGSTWTDANTAVLATADMGKIITTRTSGATLPAGGQAFTTYEYIGTSQGPKITADGSGQIYIGIIAGGTFTLVGPTATVNMEFDG